MREPSPYAGQTVRLRADAAELGGHQAEIVDWYERTADGQAWHDRIDTDPRAQGYAIRRGLGGLVDDDDVLFARVDGLGQLVHVTEIEGAPQPQVARQRTGPSLVNKAAVGHPCPACQVPLVDGDQVAVIPVGPGADPAARRNARAGLPYECVHIEAHWACVTGDESYAIKRESATREVGRQIAEQIASYENGREA